MRSRLVFALLVSMAAAWIAHFVMRPRPPATPPSSSSQSPAEPLQLTEEGAVEPEPELPALQEPTAAPKLSAAPLAANIPDVLPLERPLRAVGLGWATMAPGIWANQGLSPGADSAFSARGLELRLAVAESAQGIARALAEGGEDPQGADLAIVPLPTMVVLSELLAPLRPRIFLVTGWSRGDHALLAGEDGSLPGVAQAAELTLAAEHGAPEHLLALLVLDLLGYDANAVQLLLPGSEQASGADLVALENPRRRRQAWGKQRREVFSTRQATGAMPTVAIAPQRFLQEHDDSLEAFALAWMAAAQETDRDPPAAARLLGDLPAAPEALELLGPLAGQAPSSWEENARLAGLAGSEGASLQRLYDSYARLWQKLGEIGARSEQGSPVATELLAATVRAGLAEQPLQHQLPDPHDDLRPPVGEPRPLLFLPSDALGSEEGQRLARLGLLAAVFAPLQLRVSEGQQAENLNALLTAAQQRYDLPRERLLRPVHGPAAGVQLLQAR